jgi:hypothetical protein
MIAPPLTREGRKATLPKLSRLIMIMKTERPRRMKPTTIAKKPAGEEYTSPVNVSENIVSHMAFAIRPAPALRPMAMGIRTRLKKVT